MEDPMIKKIIGAIGLVGGLGLALLFLTYYYTQDGEAPSPAPIPVAQPQGGGQPVLEPPRHSATPDSPPVVPTPTEPPAAAPAPAAAPEPAPAPPVATVPLPEPAPKEKEVRPSPPPEPQKEHGLLVGRYRTYGEAKKRMEQITKQKLPAFIRKNGKYYEVWAGPFATHQEAAQAQKSLKASLKISPKPGKLAVPVPK
jgi:cell division septation protein DedD